MFNLSGSEIVVILLLALVVLGPEKLPDAVRRAGRAYAELRKMGNSFQSEMRSVLDEPMQEMRETAELLRQSVDFTDGEFTRTPTAPSRRSAAASTSTAKPATPSSTPVEPPPAPAGDAPASDANAGADTAPVDAASSPSQPDGETPPAAEAASPPGGTGADTKPDAQRALINRTLSGQ